MQKIDSYAVSSLTGLDFKYFVNESPSVSCATSTKDTLLLILNVIKIIPSNLEIEMDWNTKKYWDMSNMDWKGLKCGIICPSRTHKIPHKGRQCIFHKERKYLCRVIVSAVSRILVEYTALCVRNVNSHSFPL